MRQLKQVGVFLLLPFFVLIDAHISQLLGSFFPHVHLASHFLFLFLLFETIEVSEYLYLVYCFVIGLVYDVYFFHLIGIATLLFILLGAFLHKLNSVILLNRWTRMLAMIVLTFLFEMGSYLLAFMVGLTVDNMSIFIVYSLVPTMILNFLWITVFQFIFEKYYL
ncbi:rod shape-determining protein MreD [Streptococcus pseudopneumoniae]|uniref:rod shape-determining protein MreD n=1 Tax=Streptococcus TaxID=1301 RepID=UPI00025ABBF6|nr:MULTISPECIES: rod shape-determining protein MreD [Streptococcus]EID30215.1 rod shape-determining protein MreD [Streptococcus pseudopneumoniae ATCC BAA-960 = CCUG 49455]EID69847.1 rod shape-determining protein MreD [Streptococcus pseudopneumoniae SK674]MBF9606183.1 rod shape-determining protein MreD [Streptococcus pseudopneumoniae]MBF9635992.1 rod shape-determining protein MreD [Streptococcus pseudopneumoniae]MBF9637774.1 rod shape-determining protein MreD [Streptococcus pseudopneumoniae]